MQKIKPKVIHEYLPKFWNFMTDYTSTHKWEKKSLKKEETKAEESPTKTHKKNMQSEKIESKKPIIAAAKP